MKKIFLAFIFTMAIVPAAVSAETVISFSDEPLQVEMQDGTPNSLVNSIGIFEHPLNGTVNFNPASNKVKLKNDNGEEVEYDVEDYFLVPGYGYLPKDSGECQAFKNDVLACNAMTDPGQKAACAMTAREKFYTVGLGKNVKQGMDAVIVPFKALSNQTVNTTLQNIQTFYTAFSFGLCMPQSDVDIKEMTLADVRSDGAKNINSGKWLDPYAKGFPWLPKGALAGTVLKREGMLRGFVVLSYPSASNFFVSPNEAHLSYYTMNSGKDELSMIVPSVLSNVDKCQPMSGDNFKTKSELFAAGCVEESLPVAVQSLDFDNDKLDDIIVASRGDLPDGSKGYVTIYRGKYPAYSDDPNIFKSPIEYVTYAKIDAEPFHISVIDKNAALVTTQYGIFRITYKGGQAASKKLLEPYPPEWKPVHFRPLQTAGVDLGGECQGMAVTWGKLDNGAPENNEYWDKWSLYRGVKENGECGKYEWIANYALSLQEFNKDEALKPMAFALAFSPATENLDAGLWVGDYRAYGRSNDSPFGNGFACFHPIKDGFIDTFKVLCKLVSKDMSYINKADPEAKLAFGAVKEIKVDVNGNPYFLFGYPPIYGDVPQIPPSADYCKGIPGEQNEDDFKEFGGAQIANSPWGAPLPDDPKGNKCYSNDKDCDGVPDDLIIGKIKCDNCPGYYADDKCPNGPENQNGSKKCYNPSQNIAICQAAPPQQYSKICTAIDKCTKTSLSVPAIALKEVEVKSGSLLPNSPSGFACFTNDRDCDGKPDYAYYTCDAQNNIVPVEPCGSSCAGGVFILPITTGDTDCDNCPPPYDGINYPPPMTALNCAGPENAPDICPQMNSYKCCNPSQANTTNPQTSWGDICEPVSVPSGSKNITIYKPTYSIPQVSIPQITLVDCSLKDPIKIDVKSGGYAANIFTDCRQSNGQAPACYVNDLDCDGLVDPDSNACLTAWQGSNCKKDSPGQACYQIIYDCCKNKNIPPAQECDPKKRSMNFKFDLISEAFADNEPQPSTPVVELKEGTVTVLINKSAEGPTPPPPPDAEGSNCGVEIGRNGQPAAGIGGLDSGYNKYIIGINDQIRQLYHDAILKKTGKDIPLTELHVDQFAGELGYYDAKCVAVSKKFQPDVVPKWSLFQLSGAQLQKAGDKRPPLPLKQLQIMQNGAPVTITREDLFMNTATRLVSTVDTGGVLGVLPNTAAISADLVPEQAKAKKYQLAMTDKNAFAVNISNGISVNIGASKEEPLINVSVKSVPLASLDVTKQTPGIIAYFDSSEGGAVEFEAQGLTNLDACAWCHEDIQVPTVDVRALDPNLIIDCLKKALELLAADPNKDINYKNVTETATSLGCMNWDPKLGYANFTLMFSTADAAANPPPFQIMTLPFFYVGSAGGGGGGWGCSLVR